MIMEAAQWKTNGFLTLTYDDANLPPGPSLVPRDLTLFLKKLRKYFPAFRYFACGEYGDQTKRPHYHLVMFNFPECSRGKSSFKERPTGNHCCPVCDRVRSTWGKGHIILGTATKDSIQYTAGYVTKKLNKPDDERLEPDCYPEFSRMSRKPGIGYDALWEIASELLDKNMEEAPVPAVIRTDGKEMPIGPSMRKKLSQYVGQPKNLPCPPPPGKDDPETELQKMREDLTENYGVHHSVLHQVLMGYIAQDGHKKAQKTLDRHHRHERKGKGEL